MEEGVSKGDDTKRIEGCSGGYFPPPAPTPGHAYPHCPNLKEVSGPMDMEGETYHCNVCGEHFRLDYEDMK